MKTPAFNIFAVLVFGIAFSAVASESDNKERRLISSGSKWEELAAYSRAVVDGDWVFVSGTVGFDPADNSISQDFEQQMDQIFANISSALGEAGADLSDIVRVRCFLTDAKYVGLMSQKLHQYLSEVRPANTTVITALAAEGALIEVEVTALRRKRSEPAAPGSP